MICQETETKLSKDRSTGSSNFDSGINGCRQTPRGRTHIANHEICEVDSKEIVGIGVTIERLTITNTSERKIQRLQPRRLCPG